MDCPQIGTVEQYLNNVRSIRVADRPTADQSCIVRLPSLAIPKMTARAVAREDSFTQRVALLLCAWLICKTILDHRDLGRVRGLARQGFDLSQVTHQRRYVR